MNLHDKSDFSSIDSVNNEAVNKKDARASSRSRFYERSETKRGAKMQKSRDSRRENGIRSRGEQSSQSDTRSRAFATGTNTAPRNNAQRDETRPRGEQNGSRARDFGVGRTVQRSANGAVQGASNNGPQHTAPRRETSAANTARREVAALQNEPIRLQAFLAHAGVASRRACESIIAAGRVTVNGVPVTEMGTKVLPTDTVCVDGNAVAREEVKRYVLLNKPSGYVCSMADEKGRAVAADLLKPHFTERLYNVGRLDMFSSGAILFTNDGDFAAAVSHPSSEIEKEYIVETSLPYPRDLCKKFMRGVRVDNVFYKCRSAEELSSHRMRIVLIEGKNREIRRVLDSFDVRVKSLTRTRIAFLSLTADNGTLAPAQFRELTATEVERLLRLCKKTETDTAKEDAASGGADGFGSVPNETRKDARAFVKRDVITY